MVAIRLDCAIVTLRRTRWAFNGANDVRAHDRNPTLVFFDPETRELLRTRPSPPTYDEAARLRGPDPPGPHPGRRSSPSGSSGGRPTPNTGVIMVAGQKVALGRIHARATVTVYVAETTLTIEAGDDVRIVARTTTQTVRNIKPMRPARPPCET